MKAVKKLLKTLRAPSKLRPHEPELQATFNSINDGVSEHEKISKKNAENIALRNHELQREALQKSLNIAYATSVIALLAVLVSILSIIVALRQEAPKVEVSVPQEYYRHKKGSELHAR